MEIVIRTPIYLWRKLIPAKGKIKETNDLHESIIQSQRGKLTLLTLQSCRPWLMGNFHLHAYSGLHVYSENMSKWKLEMIPWMFQKSYLYC